MTIPRLTLKQRIQQRQADIAARFPGDGVYRRRSVLGAQARVMAGAEHGLTGYLDHVGNQLQDDTCDDDVLLRKASIYGMTLIDAQRSAGHITVSGIVGAQLDVTDRWQSSTGIVYTVAEAITLTDVTASVSVIAEAPGLAGNLDAGATLSLILPVDGIEGSAIVATGGLNGGSDIESVDSLRTRYIARKRKPPQGGADTDYEGWALGAHPDVETVWVSNEQGPGYVLVRFIIRESAGGPIPGSTIVDIVNAYIQARRPVTARVTVLAPVPVSQNYSIQLIPDTSGTRTAVTEALQDIHRRDAKPSGTLLLSHINEAISTAAGETDHVLTVPASNVAFDLGEYPVLGTITWL